MVYPVGFIIVLNGISNIEKVANGETSVGFIIVLNGISNGSECHLFLVPVGFIIVLNGISNRYDNYKKKKALVLLLF